MNWIDEAIERLEQHQARLEEMELLSKKISYLLSDTGSNGSVSDIQHNDLLHQLESARMWVDIVDRGLSILTGEEKLLLERFYISGGHGIASKLAGELSIDIKTVYHRKSEALRKFTIALFGCVDS